MPIKVLSTFFYKSSSLHYISTATCTVILLYLILSINKASSSKWTSLFLTMTSLLHVAASLSIIYLAMEQQSFHLQGPTKVQILQIFPVAFILHIVSNHIWRSFILILTSLWITFSALLLLHCTSGIYSLFTGSYLSLGLKIISYSVARSSL